jgi:hypothetical protein
MAGHRRPVETRGRVTSRMPVASRRTSERLRLKKRRKPPTTFIDERFRMPQSSPIMRRILILTALAGWAVGGGVPNAGSADRPVPDVARMHRAVPQAQFGHSSGRYLPEVALYDLKGRYGAYDPTVYVSRRNRTHGIRLPHLFGRSSCRHRNREPDLQQRAGGLLPGA